MDKKTWIEAIMVDINGDEGFYIFDNVEEMKYFLAHNQGLVLKKATYRTEERN